jgi:serine/threonine-protein kinase
MRNEAERSRTMAAFGLPVSAAVALALLLLPSDPIAMWVHLIGLMLGGGACAYVLARLRRGLHAYRPSDSLVLGLACAGAAATGFYFWGVFSGIVVVVPAGALLLGQTRNVAGACTIAALFQGCHLVIALLIIFGFIEDRGFTTIGDRSVATQVVRVLVFQMVMLGTFAVARSMRQSVRRTVEQLDAALRALAQRDVLLLEAARERDQALLINRPGRYTGQVIGCYQLGVVIGRGAMGVVYEAQDMRTQGPVAVKLLHPHILASPDQFRRFARELRIATALEHPNVVQVYHTPIDEPFPYMAMERLTGCSLGDYLTERPVMPVAEVVEMVRQIGRGLEAAHALGIIHRDLKPRNIFLLDPTRGNVRWKILDFGTCRDCEHEGTLTEFGHVVGTPAYMAPEQARGAQVDYRADLYSLASVAYRALTGHPPFANREVPRLLHDVVYKMPAQPSWLQPLPRDIDRVFALALSKRPYERFASSEDFARALEVAALGELDLATRQRADTFVELQPWTIPTRKSASFP